MEIETHPQKRCRKTVLIVEDNAIIRGMIADAFTSDGFKTCVEADNGKEGVAAAEHIEPDVITLDLSMPVMNGIEAVTVLRKLFPKAPIILFTQYNNHALDATAAAVGINPVLQKTVPLSTLLEKARSLVGD